MEKRLILAVGLSLVVVFVFQAFFAPKPSHVALTQTAGSSQVSKEYAPSALISPASLTADFVQNPDIKIETHQVNAGKFTFDIADNGASIQGIYLNDYKYRFPIKGIADIKSFEARKFSFASNGPTAFSLTSSDGDIQVVKNISVNKYAIKVNYILKNNSQVVQNIELATKPFDLDLSRLDINVTQSDWTLFEYSFKTSRSVERKEHTSNFNDKINKDESKIFEWLAFRDRYFATVVKPQDSFKAYSVRHRGDKELDFVAELPVLSVDPGKSKEYSFTVFCGPQKLDILKEASPGFEKVMVFSSWGWLDMIAKAIYWVLGAVHHILPIWGLCIIVVSLIVYGAMYPLTLKSMMSMKKMQALQPKMTQLKEKYKDNAEKLNKEIVELYRVNNVNPVSGCLPMLIQMPIFVGLYQVLWRSIYFRGESFLWIKDLSMPDHLIKFPVTIPFIGDYFNILPLLMVGIMSVQQAITIKNATGGDPEQVQQQKMMAIMMPVLLGVMFYNFASGLNLYFVVFYSLSALSQWNISKDMKAST